MPQTKLLSYPCSQAILQHMDPNLRYLLVSRARALRTAHLNVPIKIKHLRLSWSSFKVNHLKYSFQIKYQTEHGFPRTFATNFDLDVHDVVEAGDIQLQQQKPYIIEDLLSQTLWYSIKKKYVRYPEGYKIRDALRQHLGNFLGNNPIVKVLKIASNMGVVRLPKGIKFTANEVDVIECDTFDKIREIFYSFPLKNLSIRIRIAPELDGLTKDTLGSTNKLTIRVCGRYYRWVDRIVKIAHHHVRYFGLGVSEYDVTIVAQGWLKNPRDIGTKVEFEIVSGLTFMKCVKTMSRFVQGMRGQLPSKRYPECFTLKVNETAELNIYRHWYTFDEIFGDEERWNDERQEGKSVLVLEMMPLGSAQLLV